VGSLRRFSATMGLVAGALFCGNACAMNTPASQSPHCRVVDGAKLPAASGGAAALCAAIEQAVSARAPGVAYSAEIRALSASRLAATMVVNGRALPEQNFARMDRELDRPAFERFAAALAEQVAKAGEPK
jgi:hypothetical protein